MRIGVLELSQNPTDTPQHFVSKPLAQRFLNHFHKGKRAVVRIDSARIQIVVNMAFAQLKGLLKPRSGALPVPLTNTRWDWAEPVIARYPARDQTSYGYGIS